jgi:hypothetical protein
MLTVNVQEIEAVLVQDGWHLVEGRSFKIDSLEFGPKGIHGADWKKVATWLETPRPRLRQTVTVPFESILGIKEKAERV